MEWIYKIKKFVPSSIWKFVTTPYWWWYNRARHQVAGVGSRRLRRSREEIHKLRDVHAGERCFVIGNGPSLKKMDLGKLRNEVTFGMNRIYLLFSELGFPTSYLVSVNTLVIEQSVPEIEKLAIPKFITWRARKWLRHDPGVIFMDTDYADPPTFSRDVSGRVFEGSTVTYVALQLAYHMGFSEVILIGVDHSFTTKGAPNRTITSDGDDPNHFSPEYFGKGFRWQLPDLEASEQAYVMARNAYEKSRRIILDATVDGKLSVFPKVKYEDLF
jgi:hypothetical protein